MPGQQPLEPSRRLLNGRLPRQQRRRRPRESSCSSRRAQRLLPREHQWRQTTMHLQRAGTAQCLLGQAQEQAGCASPASSSSRPALGLWSCRCVTVFRCVLRGLVVSVNG